MSIASYFFIATSEEAARNDGFEGGPEDQRAVFYRVMDIGIKPLYEIITGSTCPKFDPVVMNDDFTQITFAFPSEFVSQLAAFDDSRFDSVIFEWLASEESPYDSEDDLRGLLSALVRLASRAKSSQRNMYLWNSL